MVEVIDKSAGSWQRVVQEANSRLGTDYQIGDYTIYDKRGRVLYHGLDNEIVLYSGYSDKDLELAKLVAQLSEQIRGGEYTLRIKDKSVYAKEKEDEYRCQELHQMTFHRRGIWDALTGNGTFECSCGKTYPYHHIPAI